MPTHLSSQFEGRQDVLEDNSIWCVEVIWTLLIDWFYWHVNPSGVILWSVVGESHPVYVHIYIFLSRYFLKVFFYTKNINNFQTDLFDS